MTAPRDHSAKTPRNRRLDRGDGPPEVVDRLAILNAAHPRKLNEGLRHPSQLARSWYFFYFALPDLPEHHVRAKDSVDGVQAPILSQRFRSTVRALSR